jgi:hypothetical protein
MATDPDRIALTLELQLSAGPALEGLGSIESQLENIEGRISNIATGLSDIAGGAADISQAMSDAAAPSQIDSNVEATQAAAQAASDYGAELNNLTGAVEQYNMQLEALATNMNAVHSMNAQELDDLATIVNSYRQLSQEQRSQLNITDGQRQALENLLPHYENLVNSSDRARMSQWQMGQIMSTIAGTAAPASIGAIGQLIQGQGLLVASLLLVGESVRIIISEMDEFAKANYRASGSNAELRNQMRQLQAQAAVTSEEAMRAGQAVFFAGIRAGEGQDVLLNKVAKLSAAYGVAEDSSARYAATMMAIGHSADSAVESMTFAAKAISKAGLSADEASQLFDKLSESMFRIFALTGDAEGAERFGEALATMTALAREAKVPLDLVQEAMTQIAEGGPRMAVALGKYAFNGTPAEKMQYYLDNIEKTMGRIEGIRPEILAANPALVQSMTGLTIEQAKAVEALKTKLDDMGLTYEEYQAKIQKQKDIDQAYTEVLSTLTGMIKQFLIPVFNLLVIVLDPLVRIIQFMIKPLQVIGRIIGQFSGWLTDLIGVDVRPWIYGIVGALVALRVGVFGVLAPWALLAAAFHGIQWLLDQDNVLLNALGYTLGVVGTALLLFRARALLASAGLGIFSNAASGAMGFLGRLGGGFRNVTSSMPTPQQGAGIRTGLTSLADGLRAFAEAGPTMVRGAFYFAAAVTIMALPIIALAGLVKLMGITGEEMLIAAGAMLAAGLLMAIVMPILAGLGTAAATTAPLLLVFALAVAVIGLAMIPAAYAAKIFSEAMINVFQGLKDVGIMDVVKVLGAFAGMALLLVPAGLAFLAFAATMLAANAAMALAMLLFPTTDFGNMSKHMAMFAQAMAMIPGDIASKFGGIRDVLSDIDDMEDVDLGPLMMLAGSLYALSTAMGEVDKPLREYGDTLGRITNETQKLRRIDLYQTLAGNVIDNEDGFKKAATIVDDYTKDIRDSLDRIHDFGDLMEATAKVEGEVEATISPNQPVRVVASTSQTGRITNAEYRDRSVELLEKQLEQLKQMNETDDDGNKQVAMKLLQAVYELIDIQRRGGTVGQASLWQ